MSTKEITHDHRKVYPEVYGVKPGPALLQQIPGLQYVSQQMRTSYHMKWAGRPEPMDEAWIVWKIVNQLKRISKSELSYKFKLMPPEIVWHSYDGEKWLVTQSMQVPEFITLEMFEEARSCVKKNLRGQTVPETRLVAAPPVLCAQKLHVGHYRHTRETLGEILTFAEEQGCRVKGDHREIYLTPAMQCHPPETWRTIVRVELQHK